jgi:hypothetical protein
MPPKTPKKKRPGRPPVPPDQRASVIASTRLPREVAEWLAGEYGGGKLTAGLKRAAMTAFENFKKS